MTRLALLLVLLLPFLSCGQGPTAAADAPPEHTLLRLVNAHRVDNGLSHLSFSPQLTLTARWMANDMAEGDYFGHTDSLGGTPWTRMTDFGYDYNTWRGENLAAGSDDPQVIFDLWYNSPGHNANMLNPYFVVAGLAKAYNPDSVYGWYWAIEFGGYDDRVWFRCWIPYLTGGKP